MRKAYLLGIGSAVAYVTAVVIGGVLWQNYSHVSQAISELSAYFAPNQALMFGLFGLYNVFLFGFSVAYYKWSQNKQLKVSAALLGLIALLGFAMLIFSQDKIGAPLSLAGQLHLAAAGLTSLTTLLAVAFSVIGFKKLGYKQATNMSLLLGVLILITGPLTAIATTVLPEYFGLFERITIGIFLAWVILVSVTIRTKAQ